METLDYSSWTGSLPRLSPNRPSQTSLLTLLLEILLMVLDHVGSQELRTRVELLCNSKCWYDIAQIVLFRNMSLASRSVCRLPPPFTNQVRLLTSHMRRLSIVFNVSEDSARSSDIAHGAALQGQMVNINRSLLTLGMYLSQCTNLEHLALETTTEMIALPLHVRPPGEAISGEALSAVSSQVHQWTC